MIFHVVRSKGQIPSSAIDSAYLLYDDWDDYGFSTTFGLTYFDEDGRRHDLKRIHIGFVGQTASTGTYSKLEKTFKNLPEGFFSVCGSVEYYKTIQSNFSESWRNDFLGGLKDLVHCPEILDAVIEEDVVRNSLLRSVTVKDLRDQFASVLRGDILLTDFDFGFNLPETEKFAGFDLRFTVKANSLPITNMHALIGRNGVGKTTYLNSMIKAASLNSETRDSFYKVNSLGAHVPMDPSSYFGSLVSVAFSAFDPFDKHMFESTANAGIKYSYIGLTNYSNSEVHSEGRSLKSEETLHGEFVEALCNCFTNRERRITWLQTVSALESDENFSDMNLAQLADLPIEQMKLKALDQIQRMSSGHTIVILSMTLLVANVDEKTLVLFDEPESHLQPPLLSALIRALGQLLRARNAVAIIATHSPVVLQEIPKSCVWKVSRLRQTSTKSRPEIETFGENVGTLTRDVFQLDFAKSGFHTILAEAVKSENPESMADYEKIVKRFNGSLGYEARGILKAMIINHIEKLSER